MKKILILAFTILACLAFALTLNATETIGEKGFYCSDTNDYGTVNIIEGYDYSSKLSLNERMVLDNGDGTYSTYPSAYALDYNKDGAKRGERFQYFDPSILNDETGYTYSHASVIRYEIPEGITIIHHDDRNNINFNTCDNAIEITFPSTLTTFTKGDFANGMDALMRADMSACVNLKTMANSSFANCPVLGEVILGPALTALPNNCFQASGMVNVTIPESIKTIGQYAFYNCKSLKTVTMHDGITSLGQKVFQYSALEEFDVPAGVTSIPQDCFHGCSSLVRVTMTDNVVSMAGYIFNGCTSLTSVTLSDNITSMNSYAFGGCSALAEITLPSKLTSISTALFRGCSALKSIVIPSGVTSIGNQAFYNCYALESVTLNEGLLSTGNEAFGFCKALTQIVIPSTVTSVGQYGFNNCAALTDATFADGAFVEHELVGVFQNCSSLVSVKLPSGITGIGYNCFYKCSKLTTLVGGIPSTVTRFDKNSFYSCTVLSDLGTLPSGLTYIGQDAFNSCKALTAVTLPQGMETIYNYAFTQCSSLTSINIPDSVTYLGAFAFYNCTSLATVDISAGSQITGELSNVFNGCSVLTSFILPRGITSLGANTFKGCKALTSIGGALPSKVTSIGQDCFNNCALLTEMILPDALETIGDYAFTNCSGLVSVVIPDSVTYLGKNAFYNCSSLTTISISEDSQIQGAWSGVFRGCVKLTSVYVPSGVTSFVSDTFYDCKAMTEITLSEGLVEITKSNNFANCTSLTSLRLPNTLVTVADGNFGNCHAIEELRLGDSLAHLGAGNLTLKALKRVYIPASLTSVGAHLLGYTNSADSSKNITFIFTGSFSEAQALRALVKEDAANAANASKLYDAPLVVSGEYDVTQEPVGYHFVYNFSKCEAFYNSHTLEKYNPCVDKCVVCTHLYAVASPVHNFEGGASIVYTDFANRGVKTNVCQNEGCSASDGSGVAVNPIFTFYGYAIYEEGTSFYVNYTVDLDALDEYEKTNGIKLDYGLVGAYVGYLNGGAPLDPETGKPVDISSTGKRIFHHSIHSFGEPNIDLALTNIDKSEYDEEFYICLFVFDGKEVKYLTSDSFTSKPDPVSYAMVRGPIDTTVNGVNYTMEKPESTIADNRQTQMEASASEYGTPVIDANTYTSDKMSEVLSDAKTIAGSGFMGMMIKGMYPNASRFMAHYLENTGTDMTIDMGTGSSGFFKSGSGTIAHRTNRVNEAMRAAEALAKEGETISIYQAVEQVNHFDGTEDWYLAVGSYFTCIEMHNVTVTVNADGTRTYSAQVKYTVTDFYNWNENNWSEIPIIGVTQRDLHQLHRTKQAKEFQSVGSTTYSITWAEGQDASTLKF